MRPELVMLEGDERGLMTPGEIAYMRNVDPELLGQVVTGAKIGALAVKGIGSIFRRIGKRRRSRVDKWKTKIRKERAKKRAENVEQWRFKNYLQEYKARNQQQQAFPAQMPGQENQLAKFIIPAIIGVGLIIALN